jgi:hypothetical protein
VSDRFVRRFDRPYGQVWHAAVLVDGSPQLLRDMADEVTNDRRAQRAGTIGNFVKGAGVLVVIGLLYLVVNAVTKGYFVRRLRAGALLLALGGIAVIALLGMMA